MVVDPVFQTLFETQDWVDVIGFGQICFQFYQFKWAKNCYSNENMQIRAHTRVIYRFFINRWRLNRLCAGYGCRILWHADQIVSQWGQLDTFLREQDWPDTLTPVTRYLMTSINESAWPIHQVSTTNDHICPEWMTYMHELHSNALLNPNTFS